MPIFHSFDGEKISLLELIQRQQIREKEYKLGKNSVEASWHIPLTMEEFVYYEDFMNTNLIYRAPRWECEYTTKNNISLEQCIQCERQHLISKLPPGMLYKVCQAVYCHSSLQKINNIEVILDEILNYFEKNYTTAEEVNCVLYHKAVSPPIFLTGNITNSSCASGKIEVLIISGGPYFGKKLHLSHRFVTRKKPLIHRDFLKTWINQFFLKNPKLNYFLVPDELVCYFNLSHKRKRDDDDQMSEVNEQDYQNYVKKIKLNDRKPDEILRHDVSSPHHESKRPKPHEFFILPQHAVSNALMVYSFLDQFWGLFKFKISKFSFDEFSDMLIRKEENLVIIHILRNFMLLLLNEKDTRIDSAEVKRASKRILYEYRLDTRNWLNHLDSTGQRIQVVGHSVSIVANGNVSSRTTRSGRTATGEKTVVGDLPSALDPRVVKRILYPKIKIVINSIYIQKAVMFYLEEVGFNVRDDLKRVWKSKGFCSLPSVEMANVLAFLCARAAQLEKARQHLTNIFSKRMESSRTRWAEYQKEKEEHSINLSKITGNEEQEKIEHDRFISSKHQKDNLLKSTLATLTVRTDPLGEDRFGNRYWYFHGLNRLFIETKVSDQLPPDEIIPESENEMEDEILVQERGSGDEMEDIKQSENYNPSKDDNYAPDAVELTEDIDDYVPVPRASLLKPDLTRPIETTNWGYYNSISELDALKSFLCPQGQLEFKLLKSLNKIESTLREVLPPLSAETDIQKVKGTKLILKL